MLERMNDSQVSDHIEQLVAEEHRLQDHAGDKGLSVEQRQRLEQVRVELDRYWDLLRQRRAREEFRLDPNFAELRDEHTVERFQQ
jgi:hypothetical protein